MKYRLTNNKGKYDIWRTLDNGKHALFQTVHGDALHLMYDSALTIESYTSACWYATEGFIQQNLVAESDDLEALIELAVLEII